jgi:hypothetical protein
MRKFQQNTWILSAVYTVEKKTMGAYASQAGLLYEPGS